MSGEEGGSNAQTQKICSIDVRLDYLWRLHVDFTHGLSTGINYTISCLIFNVFAAKVYEFAYVDKLVLFSPLF